MPEPETRQIAHDLAGQDTDRLLEETEQELAEMLGASGEDLGAIQASGFEEAGEGAAGPRVGRMIRGRVRSVGEREVYVDLLGPAAKFVGVVPVEQFDEMPEPGAELEFEIRRIEESEGILRLSRRGAVLKATWETLEPGMDVEARVSGHNKGGLELKIAAVVDGLNERFGWDLDAEKVTFHKERFFHARTSAVQPVPEVVAVLEDVRSRGKKVAVASGSSRKSVLDVLAHAGVGHRFDAIVTADDVARGKPAPDIFLETAARLGVVPGRCLVFEDGQPGLEAAVAAGMRTVFVQTHPEFTGDAGQA